MTGHFDRAFLKDRLMKIIYTPGAMIASLALLGACTTTKVVEEEVIVMPPPIEQTCVPINTLKRVVIPAETKSGFSIVSIETADEQYYDPETKKWVTIKVPPIERREPWTKVIKPEEIYYVNAENKEVTDICEANDATPKIATIIDTPNVGGNGTATNPVPAGSVEETDLTKVLPQPKPTE